MAKVRLDGQAELRFTGLQSDEDAVASTPAVSSQHSGLSSSAKSYATQATLATLAARDREEDTRSRRRRDLWVPLAIWVTGCSFLLFTMVLAWDLQAPSLVAGPFGFSEQVVSGERAQWERWNLISKSMQATPLRQRSPDEVVDDGTEWRRLVLFYQLPGSTVVSAGGLILVKAVEDKVRSLPAWLKLCEEVPEHLQSLCQSGDSMVAAAYGSSGEVSAEDSSKGILADIKLDGASDAPALDSSTLVKLYQEYSSATLLRWFPSRGESSQQLKGLRSSFAFALPTNSAGETWKSLVDDVEAALLEMGVLSPDPEDQEAFRVYVQADEVPELQDRDLNRSIYQDIWLLLAAPLGCFFAVLFATRRILVAVSGGVLSAVIPSVVSMGLLSSAEDADGFPEIQVVVLAAWFVVAVGVADLCVACVSALDDNNLGSLRPQVPQAVHAGMICRDKLHPSLLNEPTGVRCLMVRMQRFVVEAMGATLGTGLMLLYLSIPELQMVTTFGQHAGTGLIISIPLAAVLLPAAVEAGDGLGGRMKNWDDSRDVEKSEVVRILHENFAPIEFGSDPQWMESFRQNFSGKLRALLLTQWFRYTVPGLIFIIFIVVSAADQPHLMSTYTGATPQLFVDGHRLQEFAGLLSDFAALPEPKAPLEDPILSIRECDVQAHDSANCNLHACSTGQVDNEQLQQKFAEVPTECRCYTKQVESACSGSAARIWGLSQTEAQDFLASGKYWTWAGRSSEEVSLSRHVAGNYLEIENWQTVSFYLEPGVYSYSGAASWEEACEQNICFCGQLECSMTADWTYNGSLEFTADAATEDTSLEANGLENVTAANSSYARVAYTIGLEVSNEAVVEGTDDGVRFVPFDLEDAETQRQLLAICEGTAPDLRIRQSDCWPSRFKQWLRARNRHYPLLDDDGSFYGSLVQYFAEEADQRSIFSSSGERSAFWLGKDGQIAALYFSFDVDEDELRSGEPADKDAWSRYIELRNLYANETLGFVWLTPGENATVGELATAEIVRDRAHSVASSVVMFPAMWILGITWSIGLSVASAVLLGTTIMILDLFHLRVAQQQVGVLQILTLIVLMSFMILTLIRVAQQIAKAQDGPGKEAGEKRRKHIHLQKLGRLSVRLGLVIDEEEERQKAEEEEEQRRKSKKFSAWLWAWLCCGSEEDEDEFAEDMEYFEDDEEEHWKPESPFQKLMNKIRPPSEPKEVLQEPAKRTQTSELSFEERRELLKQMAVLNGPSIFRGGIEAERVGRISKGVSAAASSSMSVLIVAVTCWPAGEATTLIGIWQVCVGGLVGAAMASLLIFVCFPALLMVGLGPSRVKGRAYAYYFWWIREGRPRPNIEATPQGLLDTDLGTLGVASAKVLGFPFDRALHIRRHVRVSEPLTKTGSKVYGGSKKRRKAKSKASVGSNLAEDTDGEGFTINSLDLHDGATAPQPYHIALAVRDNFEVLG